MTRHHHLASILFVGCLILAGYLATGVVHGVPSPGVHFLDIGQGDAALFVLPGGATILVDTGPDGTIVPRLEEAVDSRVKSLDMIIITHPHKDHYGGLFALLGHYRVGIVAIPEATGAMHSQEWRDLLDTVRRESSALVSLERGDFLSFAESRINILSPDPIFAQSGELNDTSIVGMVQVEGARILMAGDINAEIEKMIMAYDDVRADILKVGHHGSRTSSHGEFLAAVQPHIAIISSGAGNRYGHPSPETLKRFGELPVRLFRTDQDGTISILFSSDGSGEGVDVTTRSHSTGGGS